MPLPILPSPSTVRPDDRPARPVGVVGSILHRVDGGTAGLRLIFSRSAESAFAFLLARGSAHGELEGLPVRVMGALVTVDGEVVEHPMAPSSHRGAIEVELEDGLGRRALFVGQGLEIAWLEDGMGAGPGR